MSMTQTTIYRNDSTGYMVKLIDVQPGVARVEDSKGYSFPMIDDDYPYAALLAKSRAHLNGAVEVPANPLVPNVEGFEGRCAVTCAPRRRHTCKPAQMTSPLEAPAQVRSARPLATGATLTMPELPQARCLAWARERSLHCRVMRGTASVTGQTATRTQLVGMARRGWLELDDAIRPTYGTITHAGRQAIIAYVARNGEVL